MKDKNLFGAEYCINSVLRIVDDLIELTPDDLPEYARDNIANDVANDWDIENFKFFLDKLQGYGYKVEKIEKMIFEICEYFRKISYGEELYDEELWYKENFINSDFWKQQRKRAINLKNYLLSISNNYSDLL